MDHTKQWWDRVSQKIHVHAQVWTYTVPPPPKKIPNIIDCNLKTDYQFNNFCYKYSWHNWPFKYLPHPMCAYALAGSNRTHEIDAEMNKKTSKNIPNIIDCNLKKDDYILIVFPTSTTDTTGHQMTIRVPNSLNVCFCTTWNKKSELLLFAHEMHESISRRVAPPRELVYNVQW